MDITPFSAIDTYYRNSVEHTQRTTGTTRSAAGGSAAFAPEDPVSISPQARAAYDAARSAGTAEAQLSEEEQQTVQQMQQRDREVRQHELQHKLQAGRYAGPVVYEYKTGPDGRRYVTGGHVSLDTAPEATPEQTLRKAQILRTAARNVSDPSAADLSAARKAEQMAQQARKQLQEENRGTENPFTENAG